MTVPCVITDDPPHTDGKRTRGMCRKHYGRFWKWGDPYANKLPQRNADMSIEEKLRLVGWRVTDTGCWEWKGCRFENGYGRLAGIKTHRLSYETWVGPIPEGKLVRHRCDNPPCMNPAHLESGTNLDNSRDMVERGRCRSGTQKLTLEDVAAIRVSRWVDGVRAPEIAKQWGLNGSYVNGIVTGRKYPEAPGPIHAEMRYKLTWDDVDFIRGEGMDLMNKELAQIFAVDPSVISKIKHGHRWVR